MWTDADAAKAVAWLHFQRAHCPKCGEDRSEWLDDKGQELRDLPKVVTDFLCPSCELLEDEEEERRDPAHPKHGKHGLHLGFKRQPYDDPEDSASGDE